MCLIPSTPQAFLYDPDAWNNFVFEGMVVWVSQGIPFATVVPQNLPRKGSVFPGSVQASQPAGRSCLQHCSPCVVPGHTQQWADVKHTAEDSSEVAATSVTALRLEEGWMWEAS